MHKDPPPYMRLFHTSDNSASRSLQLANPADVMSDDDLEDLDVLLTPFKKTTGLHPKRFICFRSKRFERNKKSQGRYKPSMARAEPGLGETLCPFSFMVFYDPKTQRWLLPFQQKGCAKHAGHCFGEKISVPVCTKTMDEKVPV